LQDQPRVVVRNGEQIFMRGEIGQAEHRHAALARTENLAGAAEPEVFFGDAEPVLGVA